VKIGDLVKMDFEENDSWKFGDVWGVGIIINDGSGLANADDVEVLWPGVGLSWEMKTMLDIINDGA